MSTIPGPAAPGPRVRGTRRRSRSGQVALASLVVVTMVLGAVTVWVGATVANGDPDDVTPVLDSLAFQRASLEGGSAAAAQGLFPEGSFFSYVLYGLAWTDLAAAGHVGAAHEGTVERVKSTMATVESALTGALQRAQVRGELAAEKRPAELARFLTTFIQGMRVMGKAHADREFLEGAVSGALKVLD